MSIFYFIAACAGVAYGQHHTACLVQRHAALKEEMPSRNPFSAQQQTCIDIYVSDVKTVIPNYDLSDRKFGGISGPFPADAKPPILAAGFGTTATRSLADLGRQLGLEVHHYFQPPAVQDMTVLVTNKSCSEREKLNDVNFLQIMHDLENARGEKGLDRTKLLMDTPVGEFFLDWYAASPDSKVILTVREPVEWAKNRKEYHYFSIKPYESPCGGFFGELPTKVLAKLMEFHHTLVRCMVPSETFLEFNIFEDKDTMKINRFFGFPHDHRPMPVGPPSEDSDAYATTTMARMPPAPS